MRRWFAAFAALTTPVAIEGILAWQDNWFTYGQMRAQGIEHGMYFWGHPGMWSDAFIINPLVAVMIAKFGNQWTGQQIATITFVAFAVSAGMHYQYSLDTLPSALGGRHRLPPTGIAHFAYMTVILTVVGLFYLCTIGISRTFIAIASMTLLVHVTIGVYVPLKIWTPEWFPQHGIWNALTLVPIGGAAVILGGLSWFALRNRKGVGHE